MLLLLGQKLRTDVPRNFPEVFPKRKQVFKSWNLSELLGQYLCINSEEKTQCWGLKKVTSPRWGSSSSSSSSRDTQARQLDIPESGSQLTQPHQCHQESSGTPSSEPAGCPEQPGKLPQQPVLVPFGTQRPLQGQVAGIYLIFNYI